MDDEELRTALLAFKDYSLRQQIAALESRVRELEAKCFNLEAEREPLIHDLERHIAIAAQEADARLRVEAELESREPSKSQIKRISAMVESAEIKRLEAERDRLRDVLLDILRVNPDAPDCIDNHGERYQSQYLADWLSAALKG